MCRYYIDGRTSTIEDFYNVQILDTMLDQLSELNHILATRSPGKKAWIGETSSAWGGGKPGASDRFVAGFMYVHLDLLIGEGRGGRGSGVGGWSVWKFLCVSRLILIIVIL